MTAHLSPAGRFYLGAVIATGVTVVLQSLLTLWREPVTYDWFVLAGLTLLSGSFTVRVPTISARLSVSETFVFATVLIFGPAAATAIVVLDTLVISLWLRGPSRTPARILFNMSAPAVAIWTASHLFYRLSDVQPLFRGPQNIAPLIIPLFGLALCYFVLNSALIARAVGFQRQISSFLVWRQNFLWLSLNYISGASVAALLLPYYQNADSTFLRILAVILPLLLISYLTFKTALGRVEDANTHLAAVNSLYMSTIETLAMAIDAKDQITHGHIRRVQTYAVALAKGMGVSDDKLIRAIEAAALLHDMGKLAVPEYILNKPGPLTPAEFEKMKLHAGVGADILSSIAFPYPVVPIVRHHHENWNGGGYPDGLRGSDIPIGARILSVVDCFDALTSDRPYRPKLPDKDAIQILRDRRGTMYDPLVVDSFIRLYPTMVAPVAAEPQHPLTAIKKASIEGAIAKPSIHLEDITASSGEVMALFTLANALANQVKLEDVGNILFANLRRLVPHAFGVLFVYAKETDELVAAYVSGESASLVTGMTVTMGQRLTGWVAANRQTIRNSDPMLDLGEVVKSISPRLRSCLSTPITIGKELVGVISLYSAQNNSFSEEHERILEAVGRQTAPSIRRALDHKDDSAPKRGVSLTDAGIEVIDVLPDNTCLALIVLNEQFTEAAKLQGLVHQLADHLQAYDLKFRRGTHQLAILCEGVDIPEIRRVVRGILDIDEKVKFAFTSVPGDGRSVDQLLAAADALLAHKDPGPSKQSVH